MDETKLKEYIENVIANQFAKIELSSTKAELDSLREQNKQLVTKLSSLENGEAEAEIPAEKSEELTTQIEEAIGEKVESAVGQALADVIERLDVIEESMTDKERIKKALSNKKGNAFKQLTDESNAYINNSECNGLECIAEKLANAKDKQELEEVKNLLQAFIQSSAKKTETSEDNSADMQELEAYRELGTPEEIEAAIEVIETYTEEIGTLPELTEEAPEEDEAPAEEGEHEAEEFEEALAPAELSSKKASGRKEVQTSGKKVPRVLNAQELAKKKLALASAKKTQKRATETASADKVKKLKELKAKAMELSSLRKEENKQVVEIASANNSEGALATSLFMRKR